MAEPRLTVAPPPRFPRVGGLLGADGTGATGVQVLDNVRGLAASTNLQFVGEPCALVYTPAGFCYSAAPGDATKTFEGVIDGLSIVPNFAAYYGVECWIGPDEDFDRRARMGLLATESRRIEGRLWNWVAGIVATAAADLAAAVALAELTADIQYIGRPVIHMNRGDAVAAAAAMLIFGDGNGNLWTAQGTPVITSTAYTVGELGVSGAVAVLRSTIVETDSRELELNTAHAIAERVYGLLVDCNFRLRIDFTA